jgi:hypothetical protein
MMADEMSLRAMTEREQMPTPIETLLSVAQPPPCIPVDVRWDGRKWRKTPRIGWELASTKRETLEEWWAQWPDAKPGIPLAQVGWLCVDVEDPEDAAFCEVWHGPMGPHSNDATPSGGMHLVFAQCDPPIAGRFQWSPGVEILGAGRLLTVYDVDEILFPRVASRATLPEIFRRPYAGALERTLKIKIEEKSNVGAGQRHGGKALRLPISRPRWGR